MKIVFLQTGGTIDKDYPRATKGYSFEITDPAASFNIGTAIGAINVLDRGVYIVMNGLVFKWDKCQRDEKTDQFIAK